MENAWYFVSAACSSAVSDTYWNLLSLVSKEKENVNFQERNRAHLDVNLSSMPGIHMLEGTYPHKLSFYPHECALPFSAEQLVLILLIMPWVLMLDF